MVANIFTFWGGEDQILSTARDALIVLLASLLTLPVIVGTRRLITGARGTERSLAIICIITCVSQFAVSAPIAVAGNAGWFPGRFLYAALPPFAVLVVAALWRELRIRCVRVGALVLYAVFALVALVPTLGTQASRPRVQEFAPAPTAVRLPAGGLGIANDLNVRVTQVWADPSHDRAWVWLDVVNVGSEPIEWAPAGIGLESYPGDDLSNVRSLEKHSVLTSFGSAYYPESRQFAERLAPGASEQGWVAITASILDKRATSTPALPMVLTIPQIAPIYHYESASDLYILLTRSGTPTYYSQLLPSDS
ncbi:MAG TPA: hypothetical protein VF137_09910 [Candidatus Dormibacteraeota bacterium]